MKTCFVQQLMGEIQAVVPTIWNLSSVPQNHLIYCTMLKNNNEELLHFAITTLFYFLVFYYCRCWSSLHSRLPVAVAAEWCHTFAFDCLEEFLSLSVRPSRPSGPFILVCRFVVCICWMSKRVDDICKWIWHQKVYHLKKTCKVLRLLLLLLLLLRMMRWWLFTCCWYCCYLCCSIICF